MNLYDTTYSTNTNDPDDEYPLGSAKDATAGSSSTDGTPLLAKFFNDCIGFFQAMLAKAYSGFTDSPEDYITADSEKVGASDVADAIEVLMDAKDETVTGALTTLITNKQPYVATSLSTILETAAAAFGGSYSATAGYYHSFVVNIYTTAHTAYKIFCWYNYQTSSGVSVLYASDGDRSASITVSNAGTISLPSGVTLDHADIYPVELDSTTAPGDWAAFTGAPIVESGTVDAPIVIDLDGGKLIGDGTQEYEWVQFQNAAEITGIKCTNCSFYSCVNVHDVDIEYTVDIADCSPSGVWTMYGNYVYVFYYSHNINNVRITQIYNGTSYPQINLLMDCYEVSNITALISDGSSRITDISYLEDPVCFAGVTGIYYINDCENVTNIYADVGKNSQSPMVNSVSHIANCNFNNYISDESMFFDVNGMVNVEASGYKINGTNNSGGCLSSCSRIENCVISYKNESSSGRTFIAANSTCIRGNELSAQDATVSSAYAGYTEADGYLIGDTADGGFNSINEI